MSHPLHKYARHVQHTLGIPSYMRSLKLVQKYWDRVQGETNQHRKALLVSLIREGENPEWLLSTPAKNG